MSALRPIAIALAALASCDSSQVGSLPVHVTVPVACEAWETARLAELPLDCGGQLRIVLRDDAGALLQEECPALPLGSTLDQLPSLLHTLNPQFAPIPDGASVAFDLEVYNLGIFCNGADSMGVEKVLEGSSEVVVVGEGVRIDVPLQCQSEPFCPSNEEPIPVQHVTATVQNLESLTLVGQDLQANGGDVSSGYPLPVETPPEAWKFVVNGALRYAGGGFWTGESIDPIPFLGCVGALVSSMALGQMPVASCDGTYVSDEFNATVSAYFLDQARIDALAAAAGVTTLTEGMILGRVVDGSRQPLAGATISRDDGAVGLQVKYLDDDATGLHSLAETSASGWFVIDSTAFGVGEPRCCFNLVAEVGGGSAVGFASIGLLEGAVTATVIEVGP